MSIPCFTIDDLHEVVDALAAAVDAKDSYTCGHSERVAEISQAIAAELGLDEQEQYFIHIGAHLHDVGKIGIPDAVITKPGRLSTDEYAMIKLHPEIGYHIVSKVKILQEASLIVRHHHERMDGQGYPEGLKGEAIPLGARIVAVADSFDAMTSKRLYRSSVSVEEALRELRRCSGTQFDPAAVQAFARVIEKRRSMFYCTA